MSFLFSFLEILMMVVVSLDTLGFIVQNKNSSRSTDNKDFSRICFTWVFLLVIRSVFCGSCCSGFLGTIVGLLSLFLKIYVSIPALKGTETVYSKLFEEKLPQKYFSQIVNFIKERTGA